MSSIDERIVGMRFDNKQFEAGTRDTISMLDRLKGALKLDGVGGELDQTSSKFSAFAAIGFSAIQRLTNSAIDFGQKIAGAVLDPLVEGGQKRALNIEQARFQFQGLGMDVDASMASALAAVKGTAYGLDEAAVVAAQFGASGMQAGDDMTNALRGISGVAAMAGSSYSDIGSVFTKVAGQGRLMGDDLNRLAVRGVNAAATLAESMGITEEEVRAMVTKGKIDFQTFADAMSEAFGEHATRANETYTGSLSNMRAAISRIGAEFASANFEKQRQIFNALTPVIDDVFKALEPVMELFRDNAMESAARMVGFLGSIDLSDLTGAIANVVAGIRSLKDAFKAYLAPIKQAWADVFPKTGGPSTILTDISEKFKNFAAAMVPSAKTAEVVGKVATNLFTALKNGTNVVKAIGRVIFDTFKTAGSIIGALTGFITPVIGAVGRLLGSFSSGGGGGVKDFSDGIQGVADRLIYLRTITIDPLIRVLNGLSDAFASLLKGNPGEAGDKMREAFEPLYNLARRLREAWGGFIGYLKTSFAPVIGVLQGIWNVIKSIVSGIGSAFSGIAGVIGGAMGGISGAAEGGGGIMASLGQNLRLEHLLAGINVGMLTTVGIAIKKFFDAFSGFAGVGEATKTALSGLNDTFKAMQSDLKANALLKIAAAIAVLAVAVVLLTLVDSDKLLGAATTIATAGGILVGGLLAISKVAQSGALAKITVIAVALVIFASAIAILGGAITKLSGLGWDELARGMVGIAGAMIILVGAALLISNFAGPMSKAAFALGAMAASLYVMAGAIALFGMMPFEVLIQGGVAVLAIMGAMSLVAVVLGQLAPQMLKGSLGLMAMALALNMLIVPILTLGLVPFDILIQGMVTLGILIAALTLAAIGLGLAGPGMALAAVGLIAMAVAINMLIAPMLILGVVPYEVLIQGLIALTAVMAVLVVAAIAMGAGIAGAAGMVAMAAAILILAAAMAVLAGLGLQGIAVSILGLVAALAVLGLSAAILAPLTPVMLGLAGAMALLGVGMLALAVATVILAPGILAVGAALALLGPMAGDILAASGALAVAGAAFIAFGAGALVAGIGMTALGIALVVLGAGMALIGAFGVIGATGLASFVLAMDNLAVGKVEMLALAGVFAVLGAALVVLGAGLAVVGVGALAAAVGLALLGVVGFLAASGTDSFRMALDRIVPKTQSIFGLADAISKLASSLTKFNNSGNAGNAALGRLATQITSVNNQMQRFATNIQNMATQVSSGMTRMSNVVRSQGKSLSTGTTTIVRAFQKMSRDLTTQGRGAERAVTAMMRSIASEVTKGKAQIDRAIKTIVDTFTKMALTLSVAGRVIGTSVGNLMNDIVRSINTGKIQIGLALAQIVMLFTTFATSVSRTRNSITNAGTTAVGGLRTSVRNSLSSMTGSMRSSAYNVGNAISTGMANGIRGGSSSVSRAARAVANNALAASRNALQMRSPSKKGEEIGKFFDLGIAQGMEKFSGSVEDASGGVANSALDEVRKVMSEIAKRLEDEEGFDFDPTITPALDLSQVRNQAKLLSGLLSQNDSIRVEPLVHADAITRARQTQADAESSRVTAGEVTNIKFEQHNNSPKALSAIDIYRQTQSQLAMIRGGNLGYVNRYGGSR